jgi:hypothetical protein
MERVALTLLLLALGSGPRVLADVFHATAEATGSVVLWITDRAATADIRASVTLSGTLVAGKSSTDFSVEAVARGTQNTRVSEHAEWWVSIDRLAGSGTASLDTPPADAWIALVGRGTTESGGILTILGGLSIAALDEASKSVSALDAATLSSTSSQGNGRFHLLITTPEGSWVVEGDVSGTASGIFVVPSDPDSMELAGWGVFHLMGEPRVWEPTRSDALPNWPDQLLAELQRLLGTPGTRED